MVKNIYRWDSSENVDKFQPYNMVDAICFNDKGKILIQFEYGKWRIPGGGPEVGESYSQTLVRELKQEISIDVSDIKLLGAFSVDGPDNKRFFQLGVFCKVKQMNERTIDPEDGTIDQIKFVSPEELNDFVDWGDTGRLMFKKAVEQFNRLDNS